MAVRRRDARHAGGEMTPALRAARAAGIEFSVERYAHRAGAEGYGREAAEALGLDPGSVFKTLVVRIEGGGLAVAVVPVSARLDLKALAAALGVKRVALAAAGDAERATGYVIGGISPLGQRRRLVTVIDGSARGLERIHVSAGRRGLEIALAPEDLRLACGARFAPITRQREGRE